MIIPKILGIIIGNSYGIKIALFRFSFDAIRIQFDTRIKELIIQGEYTLIV